MHHRIPGLGASRRRPLLDLAGRAVDCTKGMEWLIIPARPCTKQLNYRPATCVHTVQRQGKPELRQMHVQLGTQAKPASCFASCDSIFLVEAGGNCSIRSRPPLREVSVCTTALTVVLYSPHYILHLFSVGAHPPKRLSRLGARPTGCFCNPMPLNTTVRFSL